MSKVKSLTLNTNQAKRILLQPIGSGFFVWRSGANEFRLTEFKLGEDGQLLYMDDTPFDYLLADGRRIEFVAKITP